MALPMLVGGADCGPSNPLQNLSKRFEQDRGVQQDHFGAGRAGSSREVFRTTQGTPTQDHDAARFFSNTPTTSSGLARPNTSLYDLSAIHSALPQTHASPPPAMMHQHQAPPLASWAADFMVQAPANALATTTMPPATAEVEMKADVRHGMVPQGNMWGGLPANASAFRMNQMPMFVPQTAHHQVNKPAVEGIAWDKEFSVQELNLTHETLAQPQQEQVQAPERQGNEQDELARTAGRLLDYVRHEQNPKFQNSQFMGLMKQLRDGEIVVEGNQMVQNEGGRTSTQIDAKGKGKAPDRQILSNGIPALQSNLFGQPHAMFSGPSQAQEQQRNGTEQDDTLDRYFEQENAEFIKYWHDTRRQQEPSSTADMRSWDKLQDDWDRFEATANGIKSVERTGYAFEQNNPYLLGDPSSRTQHHLLHTRGVDAMQSMSESVLELEAIVQRNPNDANTWYDLGVKQQENEREHKAMQALEQAIALDPTHLPSWLALAISYTNDSNRQGTYDAIYEWVKLNPSYRDVVSSFRALSPLAPAMSLGEKYGNLIQCLITMANSTGVEGTVDADVQIALAVLLNTNEEYGKAQDCFRTALAVRPEDWLLYNRVGATMANSGRAEAALDYYYRALELNPGYIRARFNLGISCINLRRYEEAAQHILDALVLQESDGLRDDAVGKQQEKRGVVSTALWDSLKTTCLHMQRADLAALCDQKQLEAFRQMFLGA